MTGQTRKLELQLFGSFFCRWSDGEPLEVRGAKHRALLAILATAPNGTHTRAWVRETLWMLSGEDLGRASLRRSLSDLRKLFGAEFDRLFRTSNIDIQLNLDHVDLIGDAADGIFLDGLSLAEPGFRDWLKQKRHHYKRDSGAMLLAARAGVAPKLAILPFLPRMRTEDERHLADLLAMEISRTMSRSRLIDVICHLSSRRLNARVLDLTEIRETLGFDYVVYGSVFLEDGVFRVAADLADAESGRLIWSEDFGGKMRELVSGQTNMVADISRRIGHGVLTASVELAQSRPASDIQSHALLMSAVTLMHGLHKPDFLRSKAYLEELISRMPDQAALHAWLAKWYILAASQGWSAAGRTQQLAVDSASRALDHDPKCAFSLAVDGMVHSHSGSDDATVVDRFEQSLQTDPNQALAWLLYSRHQMFLGNGEEALAFADRACMLSPYDPHQYFYDLLRACAKSVCGDYEGALELADASLSANPRHTSTHRVKTIALASMGREAEARAAADQLLRWEPGLTIRSYLQNHPSGGGGLTQSWAEALRFAGIPET
ncbi:MAG: hypothetical protein AAGF88_13045 [Pseudomonadota bacterium]